MLAKRLVSSLDDLRGYDQYQTEYSGHVLHLCQCCGEQDGSHRGSCDFVAARKLVEEYKEKHENQNHRRIDGFGAYRVHHFNHSKIKPKQSMKNIILNISQYIGSN